MRVTLGLNRYGLFDKRKVNSNPNYIKISCGQMMLRLGAYDCRSYVSLGISDKRGDES